MPAPPRDRQTDEAGTKPAIAKLHDFTTTMYIYEATLQFQPIRFDADDPLTCTKRLLRYFCAEISSPPDQESLWLLCMNPKRRPICRVCLKTGPLVAATTSVREIFRAAVLAEAGAIACLRTQPSAAIAPGPADDRLISNICQMAQLVNIDMVDYFITQLDSSDYYSYREHARPQT